MISKGTNLDSQFRRLIFCGFHPSINELFINLLDEFPNSKVKIDFLKYCRTKFKTRGITYWTNLMLEHCYCIKNDIKKTGNPFEIEFNHYSIDNYSEEELVIILGEPTNQKLIESNIHSDSSFSIEYLKSPKGKKEISKGRQEDMKELIFNLIPMLLNDEEAILDRITKENLRKGKFSYQLIDEKFDLKLFFNQLRGEYISEYTEYENFKLIFENVNLSSISNPVVCINKFSYLIGIFKILLKNKIIDNQANPKYIILNQLFIGNDRNEFNSVSRQKYYDIFKKNLGKEVEKILNLIVETSFLK